VKPAAGYRGPLAYSSPEAVQTTGTVADTRALQHYLGHRNIRTSNRQKAFAARSFTLDQELVVKI
jgi:hypothetical protein